MQYVERGKDLGYRRGHHPGATATGALLARLGFEVNSSAILTRHDQASIAELTGWPQKGRQQDVCLTQNGAYL